MIKNVYNNSNVLNQLLEFDSYFDFLINLYLSNRLPKVLMLSGQKGIGKSTLTAHLLNFIFDKENYDLINKTTKGKSNFLNEYLNNIFPNIIYLSGQNFKNIKVEDIRNLRSELLKTTILNKERFIVLDDIELFNVNSLNALLKVIEEPTEKNYFILINNNTKSIIETIHSRSLELKIKLSNESRLKIIKNLIKIYDLDVNIDYNTLLLTPGNFLSFNELINKNKIDLNDVYIKNVEKILILYKKDKDINLINLLLYITDLHFKKMLDKKLENIEKISEKKSFVLSNINKYFNLNINQFSLINALNEKI